MAATVSLLQNKRLYDPVRKKWVGATPEEYVRQKVLSFLTGELKYPSHGIVVERKLSELPHLQWEEVPLRRMDILCYETQSIRPLLLIECKKGPLQDKMLAQVMGYNAFIKAPLICLANDKEFLLTWEDPKRVMVFNRLPSYEKLCNEVFGINSA